MGINLTIRNIKNIDNFKFCIPDEKGLYAITGENGSGKSTIISCAAAAFYVPSFDDYFGKPRKGACIEFEYHNKRRRIEEISGKWNVPKGKDFLGITGFYEGSIVFGNRFKDIDFSFLKRLSQITKDQLQEASSFVKENLGKILHDDEKFYKKLYVMDQNVVKKMHLRKEVYYYENKNSLINQLNMSTGENLLLTLLSSIQRRMKKEIYGDAPSFMFLDEIELALHSSALGRLISFLKDMAETNNIVFLFSTHSIELIRRIDHNNIFYLQCHANGTLEIINPCYPVYATRSLEANSYGYDCLIMVEDQLSKMIVDKILKEEKLLSNKRVLVIAIGGWTQVLAFTYEAIRSNLIHHTTTKIRMILDKDIKNEVSSYLKSKKMNFSTSPVFLPVKSLEKYLLEKLYVKVDLQLFRRLNDYLFQNKSLDQIVKQYRIDIEDLDINSDPEIKNGKKFFNYLQQEIRQMKKSDSDLIEIVVKFLFEENDASLKELINFLRNELN